MGLLEIWLLEAIVEVACLWAHRLQHSPFSLVARSQLRSRCMVAANNWVPIGVTIGLSFLLTLSSVDMPFATFFVDMRKKTRIVGVSCRYRPILLVLQLRHLSHL